MAKKIWYTTVVALTVLRKLEVHSDEQSHGLGMHFFFFFAEPE